MPPKDLSANIANWLNTNNSALFSAEYLSDAQSDYINNDLMSAKVTIYAADDAIQQSKITELENLTAEQKSTIYELSDKASVLEAYTNQLKAELDELKSEVNFSNEHYH